MNRIGAFLSISRANLLVASFGHATLGMLLAASAFQEVLSMKFIMYILLHYSIALMACNINSVSDLDVDKRYKTYISDGIETLGKRTVVRVICIELLISILLVLYFISSGYIVSATLAMLGIFFAFAYSAKPLRMKGRGATSPIPIMFGLYMLPLFGGWFLFRGDLDPLFLLFVLGYALMNEGFTLVNTCEDYSEDRAEGVRTWAHLLGLRRTLKLAYGMSFMGLLCPISLILITVRSGQPHDIGTLASLVAIAASALLILVASAEVRDAGRGADLENSAKTYGKRLPKWFLSTRYPLVLAAIVMLL